MRVLVTILTTSISSTPSPPSTPSAALSSLRSPSSSSSSSPWPGELECGCCNSPGYTMADFLFTPPRWVFILHTRQASKPLLTDAITQKRPNFAKVQRNWIIKMFLDRQDFEPSGSADNKWWVFNQFSIILIEILRIFTFFQVQGYWKIQPNQGVSCLGGCADLPGTENGNVSRLWQIQHEGILNFYAQNC